MEKSMGPPDQPPEGRRIVRFRIRIAEVMAIVAGTALMLAAIFAGLRYGYSTWTIPAWMMLPTPVVFLLAFFIVARDPATGKPIKPGDRTAEIIVYIVALLLYIA
jgi:hypothetical protein